MQIQLSTSYFQMKLETLRSFRYGFTCIFFKKQTLKLARQLPISSLIIKHFRVPSDIE